MQKQEQAAWVREGRCALGIELGSTRIKAVLVDGSHAPVAQGDFTWENQLKDGVWTYPLEAVHTGLQHAYAALAADVQAKYGQPLTTVGCIGISAMMHGYLAFDKDWKLLVPFRTWQNTMTAQAAEELTALFGFNIPQRWSIAHFYQALLNEEGHLGELAFFTTLAGYVHWRLTGQKVLGVGDASGMFPIDSVACGYDAGMEKTFDALLAQEGMPYRLADILPRVLCAGADAGTLLGRFRLLAFQQRAHGREGIAAHQSLGRKAHQGGQRVGGRGHGHGSHQQRGRAHGQCFGGHQRVCHGGAGTPARQGVSGDRYGHHPHGATGGDGTLQHLHI